MSDIAVRREGADIIEAVITKGDLAKLTPLERTQYYNSVCRSVGLNPFTRPFDYISLSGKLTLYARREATDQLRQIHGISLEVISREVVGDILTVHVRARDKTGRTDEDYGAVSIKGLAGDALANATLKSITKAKRRVTLSISGLGFLDETEIEGIPAHERTEPQNTRPQLDAFAGVNPADAPKEITDPETGEILDSEQIHAQARAFARQGTESLRTHLRSLTPVHRYVLRHAIGTSEAPGELLTLAQQADADAEAERLRTPPLRDLPLAPAGDPPDATAASPPAGAAHRWRMPKDPSARDWQAFADFLDAKLSDGIAGRALRADNETALKRLREADPAAYDVLQEKLTAAR